VGERLMNSCREVAQDLLAFGRGTQRDCTATVGSRRNFLDDTERHDVGLVTGVIYAGERNQDLVERYIPGHWPKLFQMGNGGESRPRSRAVRQGIRPKTGRCCP
jgi:hypothetical protein